MRSKLLTLAGCLLAAGTALYAGSSCLTPDTDRTCGEDEPPCYKGEICVQGRCYDRGSAPARADAADDTSSPTDAETGLPPEDTTGRDTGIRDTGDADTGTMDSQGPDSDGGSGSCNLSTSGDAGIDWPSNDYCDKLKELTNSARCGLSEEWQENPTADAGSTDAGISPAHPGAECDSDSDCIGDCIEIFDEQNEPDTRCGHRMFTTSRRFDGKFSIARSDSLRDADCACQLLAARAGVPGTYQAILSAGRVSAEDRIAIRTDMYAIRKPGEGERVERRMLEGVNSDDQIPWGAPLDAAPEIDEQGNTISTTPSFAWTGWVSTDRSSGNDDPDQDCDQWTRNTPGAKQPETGRFTKKSSWLDGPVTNPSCDAKLPIYCVQQ